MERFLVVMAGGAGTRFWPASRAARPKQLLDLDGKGETLLQAAVRRASAVVGPERVLVVASDRHIPATRQQLSELPQENLLFEPASRNTAPCIAWATSRIRRRCADAVIGVLTADPHIGDEVAFAKDLSTALSAAERGPIVTIGVEPTRPETGYGYVHRARPLGDGVYRVAAFIEKPTAEHAAQYQRSGEHLWNCGMFFFRADVMLQAFAELIPELRSFVDACDAAAAHGTEPTLVRERYAELPAVSIDYGVMERAKDVAVVAATFEWDDIGSWGAAWALAAKDADGNAKRGEALFVDSRGNYVSAPAGKLVAVLGVHDMVVVDTEDALLIVPRDRAQEVRKIVAALRDSDKRGHL